MLDMSHRELLLDLVFWKTKFLAGFPAAKRSRVAGCAVQLFWNGIDFHSYVASCNKPFPSFVVQMQQFLSLFLIVPVYFLIIIWF
jgi:hypothetical protein